MKNIVENQYIKIDNSDFSFLTNQKPWLKIPADGSPLTFTGNADEAAKEFFNALIRVRDGYISALKAERDAQQKRADALAVESKTLSDALSLISRCYKHSPHIQSMCVVETPATDAALAAIHAQGVERLIKLKMEQLANMHPDTHAFGATAESLRSQINELQAFAAALREAK
ncbi:hypothetical protein ACX9QK_003927 [Serratia marcescens]|nr:hypothetical protein [Serratia marcescens]HEJ9047781.1 hypothetical protein [Serratia marcescens]